MDSGPSLPSAEVRFFRGNDGQGIWQGRSTSPGRAHNHDNRAPQAGGLKPALRTVNSLLLFEWLFNPDSRSWPAMPQGCLRGADILVCQLGRLSSRPRPDWKVRRTGRLESLPHIVLAPYPRLQLRNSGLTGQSHAADHLLAARVVSDGIVGWVNIDKHEWSFHYLVGLFDASDGFVETVHPDVNQRQGHG